MPMQTTPIALIINVCLSIY